MFTVLFFFKHVAVMIELCLNKKQLKTSSCQMSLLSLWPKLKWKLQRLQLKNYGKNTSLETQTDILKYSMLYTKDAVAGSISVFLCRKKTFHPSRHLSSCGLTGSQHWIWWFWGFVVVGGLFGRGVVIIQIILEPDSLTVWMEVEQ